MSTPPANVKRERSTEGEDDELATPPPKRARKPATPKTPRTPKAKTPKVKPKTEPAEPGTPVGSKKSGSWSGDELLRLYMHMYPKASGIDWQAVAVAVGTRDIKSCRNKWARIQDKIREAVMGLGE